MVFRPLALLAALLAAVYLPDQTNAPPNAKAEAPRHRDARVRNLHVRPDGSATSENWSGYVVTGVKGSVTDIRGSWMVPAVTCSGSEATYSNSWVGIDGYPSTNTTLEQIGTESDCQVDENGTLTPVYYAWYEFIPNELVEQKIEDVTLQPGDQIFAEVSFTGGQFTVTLWDETPPPGETTPQTPFEWSEKVNGAQQSSADWIAEAPLSKNADGTLSVLPLANFGTVSYGNTFTGMPETCFATLGGQTNPIGMFPAASQIQITMTSDGTSTGNPEAIPSPLSTDGSSFSVSYVGFNVLHIFNGSDGAGPNGGLIQATNGNFYGTTICGGANGSSEFCPDGGNGTVFQITPSGTFTTLYSFCAESGCTDGAEPIAPLTQATNGNLYGTTDNGGA